jgi:hypothetical protein
MMILLGSPATRREYEMTFTPEYFAEKYRYEFNQEATFEDYFLYLLRKVGDIEKLPRHWGHKIPVIPQYDFSFKDNPYDMFSEIACISVRRHYTPYGIMVEGIPDLPTLRILTPSRVHVLDYCGCPVEEFQASQEISEYYRLLKEKRDEDY